MTLLGNSKSGERYHKQGHFSLLGGEYQPPFVIEKNRTSLRKSNFPTESLIAPTADSSALGGLPAIQMKKLKSIIWFLN
jgi:hypothetical protein